MANFLSFSVKKWREIEFNESLMDRLSTTLFKLEKACFITL